MHACVCGLYLISALCHHLICGLPPLVHCAHIAQCIKTCGRHGPVNWFAGLLQYRRGGVVFWRRKKRQERLR